MFFTEKHDREITVKCWIVIKPILKLFFSDRYQKMKLFIPISHACVASSQSASTAKTLLQEIEDVLKDDEDKDIGYIL